MCETAYEPVAAGTLCIKFGGQMFGSASAACDEDRSMSQVTSCALPQNLRIGRGYVCTVLFP